MIFYVTVPSVNDISLLPEIVPIITRRCFSFAFLAAGVLKSSVSKRLNVNGLPLVTINYGECRFNLSFFTARANARNRMVIF